MAVQKYRYRYTDAYGEQHIKWAEREIPDPVAPPISKDERERRTRAKRDNALMATDYTQSPDAPYTEEERAAWATFRQALRDLPEQPGWPDSVTWPVPPT